MVGSISPSEGVDLYLEEGKKQFAPATCRSRGYHLQRFVEWCEQNDVEDLDSLTGRHLYDFKVARRDEGKINTVTQKKQLTTLRLFLRFCEQLEFVPDNLADRVMIPRLKAGEDVRDTLIDADTGNQIVEYLTKFDYASPSHVAFHLLWVTGMRTGSLCSLDVEDIHPEDQFIEVRHRPAEGTTLKNKANGERDINVTQPLATAIADYITMNRRDEDDEFGRRPLLTTWHGRADPSLVQKWVYKITRPCHYSASCPFERDIQRCEAMTYDTASKCPGSVSPHPIRRSAITAHLQAGVPKEVVAERSNVSIRVINEYYDFRSEADKRKNRREFINLLG